jgi:hypothetical protein
MRANYFRWFGVLTLLLDLILFFFAIDALSNVRPSPGPSVRTLASFIAVIMVGFGLLCLRKWAAIYFAAFVLLVSSPRALVLFGLIDLLAAI